MSGPCPGSSSRGSQPPDLRPAAPRWPHARSPALTARHAARSLNAPVCGRPWSGKADIGGGTCSTTAASGVTEGGRNAPGPVHALLCGPLPGNLLRIIRGDPSTACEPLTPTSGVAGIGADSPGLGTAVWFWRSGARSGSSFLGAHSSPFSSGSIRGTGWSRHEDLCLAHPECP